MCKKLLQFWIKGLQWRESQGGEFGILGRNPIWTARQ